MVYKNALNIYIFKNWKMYLILSVLYALHILCKDLIFFLWHGRVCVCVGGGTGGLGVSNIQV